MVERYIDEASELGFDVLELSVGFISLPLGIDKVMFEAADPAVFEWYVKTEGSEVNLFVDHSQIVQLTALRSGIWGTKGSWGRVLTYKGSQGAGAAQHAGAPRGAEALQGAGAPRRVGAEQRAHSSHSGVNKASKH